MNDEKYSDERMNELQEAILVLPPDFDAIREKLSAWNLSSLALSTVAFDFVEDECINNVWEKTDRHSPDEKPSVFYLPEILSLFLEFGMNPNDLVGPEHDPSNIMFLFIYMDYDNYAAKCMTILFDHGGDPNLVVDIDSVFSDAAFDVWFHANEGYHRSALRHEVPLWLVLIGYGGRFRDGSLSVAMQNDYSPEIFKDYDKFDWYIEWAGEAVPSHIPDDSEYDRCTGLEQQKGEDPWKMYIFDKETGRVVATR